MKDATRSNKSKRQRILHNQCLVDNANRCTAGVMLNLSSAAVGPQGKMADLG